MNSGARTGAQRLSLIVLVLALAGAGYGAFGQADRARAELEREAISSAERAAAAIGSRLLPDDLDGSIGDARTDSLTSFIERRIFVNEATESVKVWNADAVVVFADEQDLQGTQNKDLRSKLARVLEEGTRTEIAAGLLHVFVAVPVGEDGGQSVIVELTRPYGQIASAGQPWLFVTIAAGLLAVLALVVAIRWRGRSAPTRTTTGGFSSSVPADVTAAFRNERDARQRAEQALEATRTDESKLRTEMERLTRDLREAERWISEKDIAISQHEAKARTAEERAERLEAALRSGSTEREESARRTEAELKEARAELDATRGRLEALERAQLASAQDAQSRLEDLEAQALRAQAEAEQAKAQLDRSAVTLAETQDEAARLKERLQAAELAGERAAEKQKDVAEAEARAAAAEARASAAESLAKEAEARARDAEARAAAVEPLESGVAPSKELAEARLQIVRLREALDEAQDATASEREARQRLEARVSMFDAEREALESTHFAALAQTDTAKEDLAHVRKELGLLSRQLEESTARAAHAEAKVLQLSDDIRELEARPDNTAELEAARGDLDALASQLSAAESALQASRSREEAAAAELARARSEAESAGAAAREAGEQIEATRAEAEELLQRLDEHVQRAAHAEARVLELANTVRELETRPDLSVDLEAARGALEAARADVTARENELAGVRTELDALRRSLQATRDQSESTDTELARMRAEVESMEAELDRTRSHAEATEQELARMRSEAETADRTTVDVSGELKKLEDRAAGAEARVLQLTAIARELEDRPDLGPELAAARAEVEGLSARLSTASDELVAARSEAESAQAGLAGARDELQALRAATESARTELDTARGELDAARAELRALRDDAVSAGSDADGSLRLELETLQARIAELTERAEAAEGESAEHRTRSEELARRNAELRQEGGTEARRFEEEAEASRLRLEEMEQVVAHLQDQLGASAGAAPDVEIEALVGNLRAAEGRIEELEADLRDERMRAAEAAAQGSALAGSSEAQAMAPGAADEIIDALSIDAKRSLSAIFGLARTLSTGGGREGQGRMLQQLMTQARRMEHAIGDILDADRLARGEAVLQRRSTELDTLVRRVAAEFPFGSERTIEVVAETATIQVDPARIERIIDDMLTSAVGRTGPGDRIVLRLERVDGGAIISVEDGNPPLDEGVGAAATFLATLHDGWARVETLDDGTSSHRVFIPSIRPATMNGGTSADRAAAVG